MLTIAFGARLQAIRTRDETRAKLAAEAGYEEAICWLTEQYDVLSALSKSRRSGNTTIVKKLASNEGDLLGSSFESEISFNDFLGTRPVYKVISKGYSKQLPDSSWMYEKIIDANVVQAIVGWDMGQCKRPIDESRTTEVRFTGNDIIEIPIHINAGDEKQDKEDIYVDRRNEPNFSYPVFVGESRYSSSSKGKDKYSGIINLFNSGIYFNQPNSKIKAIDNGISITKKVNRFQTYTRSDFNFSSISGRRPKVSQVILDDFEYNPYRHSKVISWKPAVQLQFYMKKQKDGWVKITNHCTVGCFDGDRYDYILDFSNPNKNFKKSKIYAYHYARGQDARHYEISKDIYVTPYSTTPSGARVNASGGLQIYVDGNVIIGGEVRRIGNSEILEINVKDGKKGWYENGLKGKVTVVATGNIWIVSPIKYYEKNVTKGFPVPESTNQDVLGLFSQYGMVKVVNPSLGKEVPVNGNDIFVYNGPTGIIEYQPIGILFDPNDTSANGVKNRKLPEPMLVQAVITAYGGGWGVENVETREEKISENRLVVAGAISEVFRGLAKDPRSQRGFKKEYYFDKRLLKGILPGDMWLQSKYIPAPGGGWSDSWR